MTPTLHLTNWSSRTLHGPGRKFTIMAKPRAWEHGEGIIHALVPTDQPAERVGAARAYYARMWLDAALAARGTTDEERTMLIYRAEYRSQLHTWGLAALAPGRLFANTRPYDWSVCISDGDTLLCACARGAECHRRWAAPFLVRAGWRVLLDGVEVVL